MRLKIFGTPRSVPAHFLLKKRKKKGGVLTGTPAPHKTAERGKKILWDNKRAEGPPPVFLPRGNPLERGGEKE